MSLPSRSPNLDQLRKQAKELLRGFRAADPHARLRIAALLPPLHPRKPAFADGTQVLLAHALFVIARENGFPSWPRLKASTLAAADQKRTSTYPAETSASSQQTLRVSRRLARTQALLELSREVTELAWSKDVVELTRRLVLPRRDLLALRTLIVERGEHAALVDALLEAITHQSPRVRYDCVHALDHFADERCMEPLWHALEDPVPRVRRMALHVLSCDVCKLNPLPAHDDLVALVMAHALTDPSINVRRHATVALGSFPGDAQAIQMLERLVTHETDRAIRREARNALRRCQARTSVIG
jgi:hypothetical protein